MKGYSSHQAYSQSGGDLFTQQQSMQSLATQEAWGYVIFYFCLSKD